MYAHGQQESETCVWSPNNNALSQTCQHNLYNATHTSPPRDQLQQVQLSLGTHLYSLSPNVQDTLTHLSATTARAIKHRTEVAADRKRREQEEGRPVMNETSTEHLLSCASLLTHANEVAFHEMRLARAEGHVDTDMSMTAFDEDVGHVLTSVVAPVGRGRSLLGGEGCVVRRKQRMLHGHVVSFVVEDALNKVRWGVVVARRCVCHHVSQCESVVPVYHVIAHVMHTLPTHSVHPWQ